MDPSTYKDPQLPLPDQWVVDRLLAHSKSEQEKDETSPARSATTDSGYVSEESNRSQDGDEDALRKPKTSATHQNSSDRLLDSSDELPEAEGHDQTYYEDDMQTISRMKDLNSSQSITFEPTVFVTWDLHDLQQRLPASIYNHILTPYLRFAQSLARHSTDAVFITHLLLYFAISVPSAIILFRHFTYLHGVLHLAFQGWCMGTYTLMMHQHIHQRGILKPFLSWFDAVFPYLLDPLMGHTWNTYYFHHVKHHHVEGNGPGDLSSTIRYERDNPWHLAHYVLHFMLTTWLDLSRYFIGRRQYRTALKAVLSEVSGLSFVALVTYLSPRPAVFVFFLPLFCMRIALMIGNWGQHAFVDDLDPASDFRSSITLLDVSSNRFCFNDGYHTSHHLNPRRHWRDHPVAFLQSRRRYEDEHALVFRNIDYIMLTLRLCIKDYEHIAKCMIPIGEQKRLTMAERVALLKRKTRPFSEEEIRVKFGKGA